MGISAPAARAPRAVQSLPPSALRPIALGATSRGTVSMTSACRAGRSNTDRQPVANARATSCHTATLPLAATRLSVSMIGIADRLTPTSSRLRCARSARVRAARPKSRLGSMRAASTRPTANGPASRASQAVAVSCIPAPVEAATVDDHNQRNAPERNALNPDAASDRLQSAYQLDEAIPAVQATVDAAAHTDPVAASGAARHLSLCRVDGQDAGGDVRLQGQLGVVLQRQIEQLSTPVVVRATRQLDEPPPVVACAIAGLRVAKIRPTLVHAREVGIAADRGQSGDEAESVMDTLLAHRLDEHPPFF